MKKFFKNIQTVLIVVLIVIIFLLRECQGNKQPQPTPETIVKIETKYDTIIKEVISYVPKWRTKIETVHDTIHDTVLLNIDTLAILEDYFSTYSYTDTIKEDSVEFILFDTITQNRIISRGATYTLLYPTTTITKESVLNKRELYIGFGLGGNRQQLSYLGSELMLRTKKQQIYGVGLGINKNFEPIFTFKMSWKVKMPKLKAPNIKIPIGIDPIIE
tara:strand:+ start:701 stop:1351 length:651 start_codon:yes stop_codon:yes gene_type:complete